MPIERTSLQALVDYTITKIVVVEKLRNTFKIYGRKGKNGHEKPIAELAFDGNFYDGDGNFFKETS